MRTEMVFANETDTPIKARALFDFGSEHAGMEFRQGDDTIILVLPARMHTCIESLARVFNLCVDEKPASATDDRGQYIGLARE